MNGADKTLNILEVFLKHDNEISLGELANLSGVNVSTAYRIASTLVKRGYLNQWYKRGKYSLSPKLLQFGIPIKSSSRLREIAYPFLVNLNKITNEGVNLVVLDRLEAVNIEHVESTHSLRFTAQVGARMPLHCTAVGKMLLANVRDNELTRYLEVKQLVRFTEHTITDTKLLKEELANIRREEIAIDNEENELGVMCIASPIKDSTKMVIAAVNVSGPSARLNGNKIREFKLLVKDYGLKISRTMGYRGD